MALFLFGAGPIWSHVWEPDASILWSYVPIPAVAAAILLFNRRLSIRRWIAGTLSLAAAKYLVTAGIYVALLAASPARGFPRRERIPTGMRPATDASPRADTGRSDGESLGLLPLPGPASSGSVAGTVLRDGVPVAGALVRLLGESDRFGAEAPREPLALAIGAGTIAPAIAWAHPLQPVVVLAADGAMHTLLVSEGPGRPMRNVPILEPTVLDLRGLRHDLRLRCGVHAGERATLLLVAHPWITRTDPRGRFEIRGAPAGACVVEAILDGGSVARAEALVVAGGATDVELSP